MKRIFAILSNVFRSRFKRELVSRPQPDDQAFHEVHCGSSGIPEDIPLWVKKVCIEQLGDCWKGLRPDDNICELDPELSELFMRPSRDRNP